MDLESELKYIKKIANKYTGNGIDFDEMVQVGYTALLLAKKSYKANKGLSFLTYAGYPVNAAIRDFCEYQGSRHAKCIEYEDDNHIDTHYDTILSQNDTIAQLRVAIVCLKDDLKAVMELTLQEKTLPEIAALTHKSMTKVKELKKQAIERLKELMCQPLTDSSKNTPLSPIPSPIDRITT